MSFAFFTTRQSTKLVACVQKSVSTHQLSWWESTFSWNQRITGDAFAKFLLIFIQQARISRVSGNPPLVSWNQRITGDAFVRFLLIFIQLFISQCSSKKQNQSLSLSLSYPLPVFTQSHNSKGKIFWKHPCRLAQK